MFSATFHIHLIHSTPTKRGAYLMSKRYCSSPRDSLRVLIVFVSAPACADRLCTLFSYLQLRQKKNTNYQYNEVSQLKHSYSYGTSVQPCHSTNKPRKDYRRRETESAVPAVDELRCGCLRQRWDIEHFLVRIWLRGRFNANSRGKVFSKEEICDVTTGYYGRFDGRNHGVEGVDVVKTFIEFNGRESRRRGKHGRLPLRRRNHEFSWLEKGNRGHQPRVYTPILRTLARRVVREILRITSPRTRSSRRTPLVHHVEWHCSI